MKPYYSKMTFGLTENNQLFQDYSSFIFDHPEVPGKIYNKKNTFKQCVVPLHYFENEPIEELIKEYQLRPVIFLIEAGYVYNWHRDSWRNSTFNLMLNDDLDYLVMFAKDYPDTETAYKISYTPTVRLVYEEKNFYVLNTQIPHISINYGSVNRYLLTLAKYTSEPVVGHYGAVADQTPHLELIKDLEKRNLILHSNLLLQNI